MLATPCSLGYYKDNVALIYITCHAPCTAALKFHGPRSTEALGAELAAAGIGVKPAYCFSDRVTPDVDYFRVGFGEAVFPAALAALTAFVEERKAGWLKEMGEE